MTTTTSATELFGKLVDIMRQLRDPKKGCPWDLEQTHASLGPLLIEEVYEVCDAVTQGNRELAEELGDVLSIWMLFCQIGVDEQKFTHAEVIQGITEKLIRRHPHVFGDVEVNSSQDVMKNWEGIKQKERKGSEKKSIVDHIPKSMPALLRAHRVSEKCARVGFEWDKFSEIKDKVLEEVQEFTTAMQESPSDREQQEEEFGDILFALVQLARRSGSNAEDLLQRSTNKFIKRFQAIENLARERGHEEGVRGMSLEQMDGLWEEVKRRG